MAQESNIEWTESTWNPWHGCHKKSPGCKNCYMFRDKERYRQNPNIVVRSKTTFNAPLKWKEPQMVFTCSWSDFFIKDADEWRDEAWQIIRDTPHIYQILTKEPERIGECLPSDWGDDGYENVWLGTSVENGDYLWRVKELLKHPAKIHWLSLEPLLSAIDLHGYIPSFSFHRGDNPNGKTISAMQELVKAVLDHRGIKTIDWVVAGGESGPKARPMHPDWARFVRDQCNAAGVPFFFKQWGEYRECTAKEIEECEFDTVLDARQECGDYCEEELGHIDYDTAFLMRVGKKKAGRILDGKLWDEMPEINKNA